MEYMVTFIVLQSDIGNYAGFTGLFVHGFLPGSMLESVHVPVIKDNTDSIDHLTRLPSKEHLKWQHTRTRISYRDSTHAIISATCPYYNLYEYNALTRCLPILCLNI